MVLPEIMELFDEVVSLPVTAAAAVDIKES